MTIAPATAISVRPRAPRRRSSRAGRAAASCGRCRAATVARAVDSRPHPVLAHRLLGGEAGQREEHAGDEQDRGEGEERLRRTGTTERPSTFSTSAEASGRVGSKRKVRPSIGLGAKLAEPATIESMIASPSARAVASTAAATIAGRAVRTEIVHITRQRLAPSAAAPSVQLRGTARSASTTIAIMIGTIITVRIRIADDRCWRRRAGRRWRPIPCARG